MNKTVLLRSLLCAALLAPVVPITPNAAAQGATGAANALNARVIVKYKADAVLLRKRALSASAHPTMQAEALGQRHGLALRTGAALHEHAQVVFASGITSDQLAATLAQDAEVEYAVPDLRKRATLAPNDSRYTTVAGSGPASGQWYLRPNNATVKSSIDVEPAWAITEGSAAVVVAVLDTGVRFDHPDLKALANGGSLLPGYDMINDLDVANDGNLRDADATDPGDWLDQADVNSGKYLPDCTAADIFDSTWHGTQTAALIGALTHNTIGMAGVGRGVRILPVRVLGKCGGFDSDIVAGMRWAAGLSVPGEPANPNPAKVINISLGGGGPCTPAYQDAVNEVVAAGVTIVASAGNSDGHAVASPANCAGVIAVTGLRHVGSKVGFSSIGPEVSISAPGGNCVNLGVGQACLYPILTASNSGLTTPGAPIYTDSFNITIGTSFSAPLVAGTAALLLSVQPALSPSQVRSALQSTARPFPTTGAEDPGNPTIPQCVAPSSLPQDQCYCTTATCGAGMLDAGAAVSLVSGGLRPQIAIEPGIPVVGQSLKLSSSGSTVPGGRSIQSQRWTVVSSGGIVSTFVGAADGVDAFITPSAGGRFSISLILTDSTAAQATTTRVIDVPGPPPTSGGSGTVGGGSGGGAMGSTWLVLLLGAVLALARHRA